MTAKTRYYCAQCGDRKWLPERPLARDRPVSIRTGCAECGMLTRHRAQGVPP